VLRELLNRLCPFNERHRVDLCLAVGLMASPIRRATWRRRLTARCGTIDVFRTGRTMAEEFVGRRREELAAIGAFADGRGSCGLLIEGEADIGKTRLGQGGVERPSVSPPPRQVIRLASRGGNKLSSGTDQWVCAHGGQRAGKGMAP
jgi:hypothetical protein